MTDVTWRGSRSVVAVAALLAAGVVGMGVDHFAFAQQPGIKRTELLRSAIPGDTINEAVMAVAEIPAGAQAGRHRHNGIELGYVLEGSVQLEHDGEATRTLVAGQGFKNAPGLHNAQNLGKVPVKILAVYIVQKGKPLAEPAP
jgi:quercetin dioxygenase-like cupin family protein